MCLHYLVKLIARVLLSYITYFSIQHQIFTNCWNNSSQQSTTLSVVFTDMGNHAGEGEEEDCKCWRTSPAHRGQVGRLHLDQRIIDGAVKEWRKRLRACATAEGGQFEHELWLLVQQCWCIMCIMTLPFNRLTAYNICRDCFQCSLTLSVTCSRCEAL